MSLGSEFLGTTLMITNPMSHLADDEIVIRSVFGLHSMSISATTCSATARVTGPLPADDDYEHEELPERRA